MCVWENVKFVSFISCQKMKPIGAVERVASWLGKATIGRFFSFCTGDIVGKASVCEQDLSTAMLFVESIR